ncbi:hypothetical protein P4234_17530 [Pseudomonas aeruginosa]|nr:hypothetical protein [Pseudomonas aeruginosa]
MRDVVLGWVEQGVTLFRVDNPHTKPLPFWEWLIAEVRGRHPQVIFLSEAFTRPAMMARLGKVGFSQSYTYFTWRNDKQELAEYFAELNQPPWRDCYRPNFFVNTPDINPWFLQRSGRPGFLIRAALATMGSGLWGMYSGFELCEAAALPRQGGVPRLGEIPVASARLPGAGQHRRRDRPAQPHPSGKPGIADAPRGSRPTTPGTTASCISASAPRTSPTSSWWRSAWTRTKPRRRISNCRCGSSACPTTPASRART